MTDGRSTPPTAPPPEVIAGEPIPPPTALSPLDLEGRRRRAIAAMSLCLAGATPSFMLAASEFNLPGMLVGVVLFAVAMVAISWSGWFRRLSRQPHLRSSLSIVYVGRLILSVAWPFVFFLDGFPGLFAVQIVTTIGFDEPSGEPAALFGPVSGFLGTLLTVMVQGVLLNTLLLLVAMGVWILQLLVRGPAVERPEGTSFCRRCGYCRDGFPPDHPCQECGDGRPPLPWAPSWVDRWTMKRLVTAAIMVPGLIGGVAVTVFLVTGPP